MDNMKGLLTEEQAMELWTKTRSKMTSVEVVELWKSQGYIKENPVEEFKKCCHPLGGEVTRLAFCAIEYLEKQIEELKKG